MSRTKDRLTGWQAGFINHALSFLIRLFGHQRDNHHGNQANRHTDDTEAQHKLVKLIVKRVYVEGENVVAMTLRSDYHIVLGHKLNGPTEVSIDPFIYTNGSDGI